MYSIGKQAPGFYRYKVGSFECTSLNDGALTYPISNEYVTNVSKDQVIAAAEAAYFPQNMVVCPYNPQVINTGSKLVLIDTIDPQMIPNLRNRSIASGSAQEGAQTPGGKAEVEQPAVKGIEARGIGSLKTDKRERVARKLRERRMPVALDNLYTALSR